MAKDNREEEEKQPKFRIIDRRGIDDEPEDEETPAAEEQQVPQEPKMTGDEESVADSESAGDMGKTEMTPEEKEAIQQEAEQSFKFVNTVFLILRMISEQVWMHLGLIPNPVSQLTVKNLDEARKLIDLFDAVLAHTEKDFDEKTNTELKRLLSDLKVNYTNQVTG